MVTVRYDAQSDALYVRRDEASIVTSREAPSDGYLVENLDLIGRVIGIQLLFASDMNALGWAAHPDRDGLPADLSEAVSDWIRARG